jgi:hypothetical protein
MFIGHFAVGLMAKRFAPRASLPVLLAAPQVLDILWPVFVAAGVERARIVPGITEASPLALDYMPWSHSLAMTVVWSALFAGAYLVVTLDRRGAAVLAACVMSHWVLDAASHRPDVPLGFGEARVGLGLWNSLPLTLVVETAMFAFGAWTYAAATRPRTRAGSFLWWGLVAFLLVGYVIAAFSRPPPGIGPVIASALGVIVLTLGWAYAIERRRENVPTPQTNPA